MNALTLLIRAGIEALDSLLKHNPSADEAGVGDRCIIEVRDENGHLKVRRETK